MNNNGWERLNVPNMLTKNPNRFRQKGQKVEKSRLPSQKGEENARARI